MELRHLAFVGSGGVSGMGGSFAWPSSVTDALVFSIGLFDTQFVNFMNM